MTFLFGQERWLGDQNRLETDVVQAVNDSFQRIFFKGYVCPWLFIAFVMNGSLFFLKNLGRQTTIPFLSLLFCCIDLSFGANKKGDEPFIPNG